MSVRERERKRGRKRENRFAILIKSAVKGGGKRTSKLLGGKKRKAGE